ncbi:MAG: hypothetical protein ACTSPB_25085 [Candidatus Thorarchaeota archaeon]
MVTVGELRSAIEQMLSSGQIQLPIESGIYKTGGKKGWFPVTFRKRFSIIPSVTVQGTFKTSTMKTYSVNLPSISVPTIAIPSVSIPSFKVPNVTIPTLPFKIPRLNIVKMLSGYDSIAKYLGAENKKKYLTDTIAFSWWPADIGRQVGAVGAYAMGFFIGTFLDWYTDAYIQPHFDNVEATLKGIKNKIDSDIIGKASDPKDGSINKAFDDLEGAIQTAIDGIVKGTNTAIKTVRDGAQKGLDTVRKGVNDGFKKSELAVEDSINNSIKRLFEYLGVLDGAPFMPTKIKDVTGNGFLLYSTGAPEYHWVAVGA